MRDLIYTVIAYGITTGMTLFLAFMNENELWRVVWIPLCIMTGILLDDIRAGNYELDEQIKELERKARDE